jgi:hypothetical protein
MVFVPVASKWQTLAVVPEVVSIEPTTYGSTVKPDKLVTLVEPYDQVALLVRFTLVVPTWMLYGKPAMMLVFSCAAVSVLPAVNVNLPDIS